MRTRRVVLHLSVFPNNETFPMLTPTSWLFVKGDESVWIYRPTAIDLLICGPKTERLRCGFPDESTLVAYQADLASDLVAGGWVALGEGHDRRRRRRRHSPGSDQPDR